MMATDSGAEERAGAHFALESGRTARTWRGRNGWALIVAAVIAALAPAALIVWIVGLLGAPRAVELAVGLGLFVIAPAIGWSMLRRGDRARRMRALPTSTAPLKPNRARRVWCCGANALEKVGAIEDMAFEPIVFRNVFAVGMSQAARRKFLAVGFASVGLGMALEWWVFAAPWRQGGDWREVKNGFLLRLMFLCCMGACVWAWPTFVRLSPGRMDVLTFSLLRGRMTHIERIDLRRERVMVDMPKSVVFVDGAEDRREVTYALVPARREFARAVLMAAVSTAETPELPEDRLVG